MCHFDFASFWSSIEVSNFSIVVQFWARLNLEYRYSVFANKSPISISRQKLKYRPDKFARFYSR